MLDGARGSKKERKTGRAIAIIIGIMIIKRQKTSEEEYKFELVDKRLILTPQPTRIHTLWRGLAT